MRSKWKGQNSNQNVESQKAANKPLLIKRMAPCQDSVEQSFETHSTIPRLCKVFKQTQQLNHNKPQQNTVSLSRSPSQSLSKPVEKNTVSLSRSPSQSLSKPVHTLAEIQQYSVNMIYQIIMGKLFHTHMENSQHTSTFFQAFGET